MGSKQAPIGAFVQSLGSVKFTLVEGRLPKPGIFILEDRGEIHFPQIISSLSSVCVSCYTLV